MTTKLMHLRRKLDGVEFWVATCPIYVNPKLWNVLEEQDLPETMQKNETEILYKGIHINLKAAKELLKS